MPLDPVIAAGYRGVELPNPLEGYARVMQIQQAQQQNALARMNMERAQRAEEVQNRLRSLDPTAPNYQTEVMRIDPELGSQLMLRSKQQIAAERAAAASEAELRGKNLTYWQGLARNAAPTPTDDVLVGLARRAVELGISDEANAVSQLQQIIVLPFEKRSQVLAQFGAQAAAAPATPADVATMQSLGYPLTPQGYEQYRAAQRPSRLKTPEEEAQDIRIARESRPLPQPKEPSAPIPVVDPATGQVKYVSREEAIGKTPPAAIEGLMPKERQAREAKFPQATTAVKTFENTSNTLITDLEKLARHPGLSSITGIAAGRLPGITSAGREAEALFDKIVARGGFQELQNMRQASPTGGALGNVSNQEGAQLRQAFAALDRRQDADSVRKAIADAIQQIRASQQNVREAYDLTYEYKRGAAPAAAPAAAPEAAPKRREIAPGVFVTERP